MLVASVLVAAACGDDDDAAPEATAPATAAPGTTLAPATTALPNTTAAPGTTAAADGEVPVGTKLSPEDLQALIALFEDSPYDGGQVAPRLSKWITPDTHVFLQFDSLDAPTEVRYVGVATKGVFCAEAQPDSAAGSFPHFHRPTAPDYAEGHGGEPGAFGYWLSWMAVTSFQARDGRAVAPGIDYLFSPTPPPSCGANVPAPAFTAPGEQTLAPDDLQAFVAFFDDDVLVGGQQPPRRSKWLNDKVALFIQLDDADPAHATTIRNVGLYVVGTFCASQQPPDFPHYHRYRAPDYAEGHGGEPGETSGYWLTWMATQSYQTRDGRPVAPGIDREFSPTPAPAC